FSHRALPTAYLRLNLTRRITSFVPSERFRKVPTGSAVCRRGPQAASIIRDGALSIVISRLMARSFRLACFPVTKVRNVKLARKHLGKQMPGRWSDIYCLMNLVCSVITLVCRRRPQNERHWFRGWNYKCLVYFDVSKLLRANLVVAWQK